jgi:sortase family protein
MFDQPSEVPARPGSPDPDARSSRVLRWAVASAILGAVLLYNSAAGKGTALPTGPVAPSLPRSEPSRLSIPSIGVNAPFTALHLDPSGKLGVPPETDTNLVGWYADGPTPGERGNAIVAGHVDTTTGPAVFLFLSMLKPGSTADITRKDGTVATFRVDSVETFAKDAFPDQRVYGDTKDAELRLITCGGSYDHAKRDYRSNVVVFAHLESSRKA